jgi:hypothetical protein
MRRLLAFRRLAIQNAGANFEVQCVLSAVNSPESEQFFAASKISLIGSVTSCSGGSMRLSNQLLPLLVVSLAVQRVARHFAREHVGAVRKNIEPETVSDALFGLAVRRSSSIHLSGVEARRMAWKKPVRVTVQRRAGFHLAFRPCDGPHRGERRDSAALRLSLPPPSEELGTISNPSSRWNVS